MATSPDSIVRGRSRGLGGVRDFSGCMLKCVATVPRMTCSVRASWLTVFDVCMYYSVWSLSLSMFPVGLLTLIIVSSLVCMWKLSCLSSLQGRWW